MSAFTPILHVPTTKTEQPVPMHRLLKSIRSRPDDALDPLQPTNCGCADWSESSQGAHAIFKEYCDPAKFRSLASVRTTVSEVSMPNAWHLTSRLYYTRRYTRCRKSELFSSCVSVPMFSDTHAKCRCILCNSEDTNTTSIGFFKQLAGHLVSACTRMRHRHMYHDSYLLVNHYENTPIQIYRKFLFQNFKIFRLKTVIFFIFLLKT